VQRVVSAIYEVNSLGSNCTMPWRARESSKETNASRVEKTRLLLMISRDIAVKWDMFVWEYCPRWQFYYL